MSFIKAARALSERTRQRKIRQAEEAEAEMYRDEYDGDATSGKYDTGGIANLDDYDRADMTGDGQLFIGIDPASGEYLFDNGDYSIQVFGLPGFGKGSTLVQTNLAHIASDVSVVCVGLAGENYRVAAEYRREQLGQPVVCDNADNLPGIEPEHCIALDPIGHIRATANRTDISEKQRLRDIENQSDEFAPVAVPKRPEDKGQAGFIGEEAKTLVSSLLTFAAIDMPHLLSLPALYDLIGEPASNVIDLVLEHTSVNSVRQAFEGFREEYKSGSDRQVVWYFGRLRRELRIYRREAARGEALLGPTFDVAQMRKRPSTLFIEISERSLDRDAAHMSRILTCITSQLAEAEGDVPVVFLLDELSQLPPWPYARRIRTDRKHGCRYVGFWQSRSSGETVYGTGEFSDIMQSSGKRLYLSVSDEREARILSVRAGDKTTYSRSANVSQGGYGASENMSERGTPRLPVSDVLNMPKHGLIIDRNGLPLGKAVRQPWWELEPYKHRIKHFSQM